MSPPSGTPYPHLPSQADLFYLCTTLSTSDASLNLNVGPPSKSSLLIGILLLGNDLIQTLDITPIDLLTMLSEEAIERLGAPEDITSDGIGLDIRYVSESGEGLFSLTAGLKVPVTVRKFPVSLPAKEAQKEYQLSLKANYSPSRNPSKQCYNSTSS
jgi:hypothetical protein